ncbi:MAG: hypothetical protein AAB403_19705 [Planctomycetota bacterium]
MKQEPGSLNRAWARLSCHWRDWLAEWRLETDLRELRMKFAPRLAEARKDKDPYKYQEIRRDQRMEADLIVEPVLYQRTVRLEKKARRWLVPVPRGLGLEQDENDSWRRDVTGHFQYLKPDAELEIRRAVRREWHQFTSTWVPILFGFLGLLIGLVSVWRR